MGLFARAMLALLLTSQLAGAEEKVALNTISKVQVKGASVEIVGSQKPNFTTFTMSDPPRLVVDISEAVFSGVPEQMDIASGSISALKTATYGSDASAISRVILGFQKEVDTDIQVKGTTLVIRVLQAASAPAVAEEQGGVKGGVPADTKTDREAQKDIEREKKREEIRLAKEEDVRKQDEVKQALAAEKQRKEEEKQAKIAATQEKKRQEQEAREAKKREAEEAKLAKQQAEAEAKEAKRKAAEEAKLAKQRAADEAKQQATAEAQLVKQKAVDEANVARQPAPTDARLVEQKGPGEAQVANQAGRPSVERLSISGRRKTVSELGFKQHASASRVFVRTNEPVRYTVSEGKGKTVILELENTSIGPRNNSRFLDTSYFDTAVAMVSPNQGPTRSVRIEIRLKEVVPFEAHQEGNEVFLDFSRPARR